MKTGVLLINVGTPRELTEGAIREYLDEFLMDPFVLDIPFPLRWLLVKQFILPRRPAKALGQYEKIWTSKGSPLRVFLNELAQKVAKHLGDDFVVAGGMRYGEPSLASALCDLKQRGADRLVLFPMYPQYSLAATESSLHAVKLWTEKNWKEVECTSISPFYDHPEFIGAFLEIGRPYLEGNWDHILFSYHGLPERQIRRVDPSRSHCLKRADCCKKMGTANTRCYRAQCFETTRQLVNALGLKETQYSTAFQSRLGVTSWIRPYTDIVLKELPSKGYKNVLVWVPSFVSDCLETLEEITHRGTEIFKNAGGHKLQLIPSLNASEPWVQAVCRMLQYPHAQNRSRPSL